MTRYTDGSTHGFVLIRHLHDEATMRMRSQLPALAAVAQDPAAAPAAKHRHVPLRGRSSKIQNNVVTMHRSSSDQQLPVLIELQPLARKDAETLATSLRGVIDTVATAMAASTRGGAMRLIHCLVGDGIFTNAAAARLLWSWAAAAPVAPHYRLLVFTCSTHAANLVVRTAICDDERNTDNSPIVATCVHFFKYLMPEYAAEFVARLRVVLEARLRLHPGAPPPAIVAQWEGLQELYGKRVIPDSLCKLVNGAPGTLDHWSGAPGLSRESLIADVALEVERRCLRSEERPVTTRFWLFEGCVQTLFRWKLLDLPVADVLQTGVQKPRASNQKRISRVRRFLEDENARFLLALACLCLRLTSLATSITGQKNRRTSGEAPEMDVREPLLVRLARGDVTQRAALELTCIFRALRHDAALTPRLGEVVTRLLTTAGQIVLRFSQYAEYPARVVLMSRTYNPDAYYQEVLRFLHVGVKALDSGYSEPLRREAWGVAAQAGGSQTEAILHLLSPSVQEELSTIAMAIETSTLDVERKHNLDRRSEAPRVTSVSKASRDAFVRQWRTESRAAATNAQQRQELRAHKFANKVSVALERRPELFPQARGKLHWETRQPKRRKRLRSNRPLQRLLEEYVKENEEELEAEAVRRHVRAQKGLVGGRVTSWPATRAEWLRWLQREQSKYDTALQSVKAGVRRAVNVRMTPHPNVPQKDPAVRIKPQIDTARPPLGRQAPQRVVRVALTGHRSADCHLRGALRRQIGCFRPGLSFACDATVAAAVPAALRVALSAAKDE